MKTDADGMILLPEAWPSGIRWHQGEKNTGKRRYDDNLNKSRVDFEVRTKEGIPSVGANDLAVIQNATRIQHQTTQPLPAPRKTGTAAQAGEHAQAGKRFVPLCEAHLEP
jgi:hypothetical protein